MRTFAIGDIHGCLMALESLLKSLNLQPDDRLIFLGDYIDRGPDSRGVLDKLIELNANPRHVFLRGNHDDWLLTARTEPKMFRSWLAVGGQKTLDSYGVTRWEDLPPAHLEFLDQTRAFYHLEGQIYAHAAVSSRPPELNEPRWMMWGNFSDIKEHPSGDRIIVGHSAQRSGLPLDKGFVVCIDTHCYGGGWLSALDVWEDEVYQANEAGQTRRFRLGSESIRRKGERNLSAQVVGVSGLRKHGSPRTCAGRFGSSLRRMDSLRFTLHHENDSHRRPPHRTAASRPLRRKP